MVFAGLVEIPNLVLWNKHTINWGIVCVFSLCKGIFKADIKAVGF